MINYPHYAVPNVYLRNGYQEIETPYGHALSFEDVEGLENQLRLLTAQQHYLLTPSQTRFIRIGLELTQDQFAARLRVDTQTVARWEKGRTEITPIVDLAIRVVALKMWNPNMPVSAIPISDGARRLPGKIVLEFDGGRWREVSQSEKLLRLRPTRFK